MKKLLLKIIILLFIPPTCSSVFAQEFPFQNKDLPIEQRVEDLISRLTIDEKLGFLEHNNPGVERLGIKPYSWWNEALHGVARNGIATVYPMPIALAATFDPTLTEEVYSLIADEAIQKHRKAQKEGKYGDYTGITFFTPNINIFRDPRWGRGMETFGEDPYLTARMGLSAVRGLQGESTIQQFKTAACLKHLAVHSGPEGLRHQFNSTVSNRDLWTTYLPAFEYIIMNSNVQQVMCAYNRLNGEPCCTNRHLLVDILRNRWHYDGILVTDCWALNDCWEPDTVIPRHRTHATAARAAAAAFGSEVDLECGSGLEALKTAVDSGYITEQQIDNHLRRVLRTRLSINPDNSTHSYNRNISSKMALTSASESIVMLKNNGILPLGNKTGKKHIAIIGPNAADTAMALGNYNGIPPYSITIAKAIKAMPLNINSRIYFDTACHLADNDYLLPADFWSNIRESDFVIFCGGLSPTLEGEELQVEMPGFFKGDRTTIELPRPQRDMIKEIRMRTGKPIILVLCTGSAIALENVVDDVDAIIVAWYGGQEMGVAVVEALYGLANNFGHLPVTFYKNTKQLPDFADYNMQHRTYRYTNDDEVLFPFGFGLDYSYTHFDSVTFNRSTLTINGSITLDSVNRRCYTPDNKLTIQVYFKDPTDTEGPNRRLVAIHNVWLEEKNVGVDKAHFAIPIDPFWLRRYNPNTDEMELPPAGTPLTLSIMGGPQIDFVW